MTQSSPSNLHRQLPKLVLLGPPGSGKGTHARYLAQRLSVPHISTGELLRREVEAQTSLGHEVGEAVRTGALVSDETIVALVDRTIRSDGASRGWILDGAPRTLAQAAMLSPLIEQQDPVIVIALDVADDELVRRLTQRRVDERRDDDAPQVVDDRLSLWAETGPQILSRYEQRGLLVNVDGTGSISEVSARVWTAVNDALETRPPT